MTQLFKFLSRQSTPGSRANALNPAFALLTVTAGTLAAAIAGKAPWEVIVTLQWYVGVALFLCCGGFIYFAVTDPDSLRSEEYNLAKMRHKQRGLHEIARRYAAAYLLKATRRRARRHKSLRESKGSEREQ